MTRRTVSGGSPSIFRTKFRALPPVLIATCVAALGVACEDEGSLVVPPPPVGDAGQDSAPQVDAGADSGSGRSCTPGDDLEFAPPATTVDGLRAVPIDIRSVDAKVKFDVATKVGSVDVTMKFKMGPTGGYPVFDLRQTIQRAVLNGGPDLNTSILTLHDFGGGADADLRVIAETNVAACTDNTLQLTYVFGTPASGSPMPIKWGDDASVNWDFWSGDLIAARYLEQWFPANLIYDKFAFNLDIELAGTAKPHVAVTNGTVTKPDTTHWQIAFPDRFTALSPMLKFVPEDFLDRHPNTELALGDGTKVLLELVKEKNVSVDLAQIAKDIESYLNEFITSTGPYQHGDRLTVYLWPPDSGRSMEFDGATTSNLGALKHELYHSWYARGVKPALGRDGWFDEAWTVYNTDPTLAFEVKAFDFAEPPVKLAHESLWRRFTPRPSYTSGRRFFAGLAAGVGLDPLRNAMKEFAKLHARNVVTTEQLEKFLYCTFRDAVVVQGFHRYVYGRFDEAPTPNPTLCDGSGWIERSATSAAIQSDVLESMAESDPELKRLIDQ